MPIYYSCLQTAAYRRKYARPGKWFTPRTTMPSADNPYAALMAYGHDSRSMLFHPEYYREAMDLEEAVFKWLSWFRDKRSQAATLEVLADATGAMRGVVQAALANFTKGVTFWERVHVPPPLVAAPDSEEQAEAEKDWYSQMKAGQVWASEPSVAAALRIVMRLRDRPWDLDLMRNAELAVRHAEQVCLFNVRAARGEITSVDEPLHKPELMVAALGRPVPKEKDEAAGEE